MTPENTQSQVQEKPSDKELNFRALEAKYQRQLEQERQARFEAERLAQEALTKKQVVEEEDDDDDEPYVNRKKLKKEQERFGNKIKQETQGEIQKAVQVALQKERQDNWIRQNNDFYDVLEKYAEDFANEHKELADSILEMPAGFERQKLVYKNIKSLGLDKPRQKEASIQEKVDSNRRGPYYQPSQVGSAPYSTQADFSNSGKKQAYDRMQDLKKRLRLG